MAAKRAEYQNLAEAATSERDRRHYQGHVEAMDRQIRTFRTHPFSIWLGGMGVSLALLPWALMTRYEHQPALGVGASGIVVAIEVTVLLLLRRRRDSDRSASG